MALSQQRYVAGAAVLRHPDDDPPPKGSKILVYNHMAGITTIGVWGQGFHLWSPMPGVDDDMKQRLNEEVLNEQYEERNWVIRPRWLKDE